MKLIEVWSGAVDKPLQSQKIVKKSKNCQKWKNFKDLTSYKGYQFGGTFIKVPIFCQLDTKNLNFC